MQRIHELELDLRDSVNKDESQKMTEENERLVTEVTEKKAAMLRFKEMCDVMSD